MLARMPWLTPWRLTPRPRKLAVVPCFGCTRWEGGWSTIARAVPVEDRVWIHATDFSRRKTRDVTGEVEHDSAGNRWFRPRKLRDHAFYLCTVCQLIFDADPGFKEQLAQRASGMAGGGAE